MDLVTYDPPLPALPLLGGLDLAPPPGAPSGDWAAYVIRLARALAEGGASSPEGRGAAPSP